MMLWKYRKRHLNSNDTNTRCLSVTARCPQPGWKRWQVKVTATSDTHGHIWHTGGEAQHSTVLGFPPRVCVSFPTCTWWVWTQGQDWIYNFSQTVDILYLPLEGHFPNFNIYSQVICGQAGKNTAQTQTPPSPSLGISLIITPGADNICGSNC